MSMLKPDGFPVDAIGTPLYAFATEALMLQQAVMGDNSTAALTSARALVEMSTDLVNALQPFDTGEG